MKTSRSLLIWAALMLCGVMVLGALIWLTRGVLSAEQDRMKADQERIAAESRADLEERTRLALWRMDALGAAILLRENRYAVMDFREYSKSPQKLPSEVLLHFDVRKGQAPTTPELGFPTDSHGLSSADADYPEIRERVKKLGKILEASPISGGEWTLLNDAATVGEATWQAQPKDAPAEQKSNKIQREKERPDQLRKDSVYQSNVNTSERAQRAKAVAQSFDNAKPPEMRQSNSFENQGINRQAELHSESPLEVGQIRAAWVAGELFLLRRVIWNSQPGGIKYASVQGAWMDSLNLREQMLKAVEDLLPNAKLVAVEGKSAVQDPLAMVSFPFRLDRNEGIMTAGTPSKPLFGAPLWIAWVAVVLALGMSSLLVHGVMRLSERRASFVSAVTHELRTPLTTFRLYSDMLESGAVKEEKRGDYLRVLSREADRLSHLVENVLSFSKIERGSARSEVRETGASGLLEPMRERLEARLATAGLTLVMDTAGDFPVRVDAAAVEHILFNLIDNAAKYAAASDPPQVEISVKSMGRHLKITITDHGPGIPASERGRIFRAFHKSAREAAESRPGVGLGLALSRRLAKSLGGGLDCVDAKKGACFVLRLPLA